MRCFAAIELDSPAREAVAALLPREPRSDSELRWVKGDVLHITLWFFGEVAVSLMPCLIDALRTASAGVPAFSLRLGEVGCFPPRGAPRVLWVGAADESGGCARWIGTTRPSLEPLGFEAESRPYHPHITLARSRGPAGSRAIEAVRQRLRQPAAIVWDVHEVLLLESIVGPGGSQYLPVARFPLVAMGSG